MVQGFEIRGLDALQRTLVNLVPATKRETKDITLRQAQHTVLDARENAPVDLGNLQRAIHFELTASGFGFGIDWGVDYGPYAEFGTGGLVEVPLGWEELASGYKGTGKRVVNRAPHPFLIPAWQKNAEAYVLAVSGALDRLFQ